MGTRGFVGFRIDEQDKITYNHYDSYPSGVGMDVLNWLRDAAEDVDAVTLQARSLTMVSDEDEVTDEHIGRLQGFSNLNVGDKNTRSWYSLLRQTQGDPG